MNSPNAVSPRTHRLLLSGVALVLGGIAAVGIERAGLLDRDAPRRAEVATVEEASRRFHRGVAKLEVGLLAEAAEELAGAARLLPDEPAVWADLGLAHGGLGAFDEAARAIGRAVALAPGNGDLLYLDARVASLDGRPEAAIATLRRAVEVDPSHVKARFALARELEDAGGPGEVDDADRQLERLAELEPDNPAVLVDRARLAAKRGAAPGVVAGLARLERFASSWPQPAVEQLRAAVDAAASGDSSGSARAIAFLRNLLLLEPRYRDGLARVAPPDPLVGDPVSRFLRHDAPPSGPAPADDALTFDIASFSAPGAVSRPASGNLLLAASLDGSEPPAVFAGGTGELRRIDAPGPALAWEAGDSMLAGVALDWNHDFRTDFVVAGPAGVRLFERAADGTFADRTAAVRGEIAAMEATGVWAADIEMDGDLDVVVGLRDAPTTVLRNNGDGTWSPIRPFGEAAALGAFAWVDLDDDGDPDVAALDGAGALRLLANLRSGQFAEVPAPAGAESLAALSAGDVDGDGTIDLVALGERDVRRWSRVDSGWSVSTLAEWSEADPRAPGAAARALIVADLDNNGALDLVVSGSGRGAVWLGGADRTFRRLAAPLAVDARSALDLDGDGRLEIVGFDAGGAVRATVRGTRSYHFHVVRPRAQSGAGDQRINSFGIGGVVEARSGGWVQRQSIVGSTVHFGLGDRTSVDVTRIVWPNGVPQADFDSAVDGALVAEQRLKGSCPWVFADDGGGMRFVTDFLWRSPLGLRLNAQETAGVTQTEDWVKIRGDQLVARDGTYDVRITAELWETHFVDEVALIVVDRPRDVEAFVDERFVPVAPPALAVHATRTPRPFPRARDERGNDVTELVARRDGRHLATFALGRFQGVADDHYVELELEREIPSTGPPQWLVGHGWIYPTDSSINVAIGQGGGVVPSSLALEAQGADGRWVVVAEGLGFPAGKNKTILIDLGAVPRAGVAGARRIRLRTNLEIYWDQLALAAGAPETPLRTIRLAPERADLRYRGYSATSYDRRERPEVPEYSRLAGVAPRWRDLAGFYTRFGDVRELLAETEDRYVIMNAGDELRLSFQAPPPPPPGWARDFVLIGDGWVKDGDFNTTGSKTVQPLPEHGRPDYVPPPGAPTLAEDPVWLRHRDDWIRYHSRFVAPRGALDPFELARKEPR